MKRQGLRKHVIKQGRKCFKGITKDCTLARTGNNEMNERRGKMEKDEIV
jgi:hypothetical protein